MRAARSAPSCAGRSPRSSPAALVLYERHENSLYSVLQDLAGPATARAMSHPVIGDVTDRDRFDPVLRQHRPDIVFHAAAHKHVPLMEQNVCEAVKNNVIGTQVAIELGRRVRGEAIHPDFERQGGQSVSVMGATKRVAELMLQARAVAEPRRRSSTVRFGNVLGSNGSVDPPVHRADQARRPGYRHASRHAPVLHAYPRSRAAGAPRRGGRRIRLDLRAGHGRAHSVLDVARDLIRLSGLRPDDMPITFIGLRPGEKLDEELVGQDEVVLPSPVQSVMQVRPRRAAQPSWLREQLKGLEMSARFGDSAAVIARLRVIVPEFRSTTSTEMLPASEPLVAGRKVGGRRT